MNNIRAWKLGLWSLSVFVLFVLVSLPLRAGAETAATRVVYDNTLASGWVNWSWSTTVDFGQTAVAHGGSGSKAIAVTYDSSWGALYLHSNNLISLDGYDTLDFWVHGGSDGAQFKVNLADESGSIVSGSVSVTAAAGAWTEVKIPLGQLGGGLSTVSGIAWQENSGSAQNVFYLDDILFSGSGVPAPTPTPGSGPRLTIDTGNVQRPINPNIYGVNFAKQDEAEALNLPLNRWGGNATTRYNWELDISNRGSDWYFENVPNENGNTSILPHGSDSDEFVEQNRATNTASLLTIPMLGWTPAKRQYGCGYSVVKYGTQQSTDPWRPDCGNGVKTSGSIITGNDPGDVSIAVDSAFVTRWIRHLTAKYGSAAQGGVRFYSLDNEPMLWHETHRDVHPDPVSYDEMKERSYRYGAAVKAADPTAATIGPALWGWTAYFYSAVDAASGQWSNPPDRNAHGGIPFVPWYLQQMRAYEQQHGVRILDYLDLHYYPQQSGVALSSAGSSTTQQMRLRSTRALWDPTYVDESWINEPVMLIPRMRAWVDENYPGTHLAVSEYNWGALDHINGALAQADVLGIFGREGLDMATLWDPPGVAEPGAFAFRIYRNYDGRGSTFGDLSLAASSSDQAQLSVYAARRSNDHTVTIVVVNKSGGPLESSVLVQGLVVETTATVYRYSAANLNAIEKLPSLSVPLTGFQTSFPANSITLFVVPGVPLSPTNINQLFLPAVTAEAFPAAEAAAAMALPLLALSGVVLRRRFV